MVGFILAVALLAIALLALALNKTYSLLPQKELKRRAREKDPVADVLYKAVAYGATLRTLLWAIIVLATAGSFVLLSQIVWPALAFVTVAITLAYGFVWMPAHKASKIGVKVAVWATPTITWLLRKLHPILGRVVDFARKKRPVTIHTGLYDKEDLAKLIESQKHQPDSRISNETLELLAHTLTFGDKLVSDSMVPARAVRSVSADEAITPVIIEELHESGFSRFPVYKSQVGNFVGTMYLRDLVTLKHTGVIADVMIADVYYVHEDHPLEQVLDAFLKTQHHMFIVVNNFEEFVGIITIEDILEEILGCKIVDEFDQYDDIRAVAAHQAVAEHEKRKKDGKEIVAKSTQIDIDQAAEAAAAKNPYQQSTLKYLIFEAGFRGEALEIAFAVALAESGGKATAHNDDESTGDDSYGLFQINMLGNMGPERRKLYHLKANKDLFHPPTNARVAFAISQEGKDWQPWSTYVNGAYKKFYNPKANASITK